MIFSYSLNIDSWLDWYICENFKKSVSKKKASNFITLKLEKVKNLIIGTEYIDDYSELGKFADLIYGLCSRGLVEKLIFLSTYCVYEPSSFPFIEDESFVSPKNYIGSKSLFIENLINYIHEKFSIPSKILRVFNVYGPFQKGPYLISELLSGLANKKIIEIGDVDKVRDFLYISDFLNILDFILNDNSKNIEKYNIGSGDAISIKGLINRVEKITKIKPNVVFNATKLREEYDYDYAVANITKLKTRYGWQPKVTLEQGLALTYQWILGRSQR